MNYIEKKLKYHDMLTETFGDEKKLKKVVDKLIKENMEFDDKQKLIHDFFKEYPTCLRCVDYQTLQKYDNEQSTLLTEMLATAERATDLPMEEFYENFIPESLKRSDNNAFLNFIFSNSEDEASLLENPNFVKTRGVTEKHWESIKKYGRSISKDDKVDTFVSHLANLKTFDQIVKEVAEFVKDPELNFSENEILKVLNNNKRLLKDTRIMSALVEKSTQETEDFDSSEFERLIKKNKSTFNKYLNETRINVNKENRKTLKTCFENIDKETLTTLFGSMSKTNRIEYSADVVRIDPALYQHKKFVKNQENSIAYVKGGGDLTTIPKKLRSNYVTASLAKYFATEYAQPEDFTLSQLFAKMESFDKKHANSTQTLDAIAKSDFYKNSSIQNKREFLSKCNKSYLSDNLPSIIKADPACLFVKKGESFTFLVGQNKRENTLWALNHAVQKVGNAPFKNFVSSLPDEVLSNKKLMNEMLAHVFANSHSHNFVQDFFASLDYKNKNVKDNLADILNFVVSTDPSVLKIVKNQDSELLESALKTKIGKKALFKAIMIDPVSVDFVEGADLSGKLANLKTKQRFVIAQSCISKLASKSYDKKYEEILKSVFELDDNGLSKGQVKKLLGSLAKNNTESFVKMYVANVFSEYKNPHVSKILEDNFAKHKNIFGKKLYENYTVSAKGYSALYEECKSQKIKQTQMQILTAEKEIKKAQDNVKWSEKVKGEFEDVVKSIGKLKSPNTVKNRISALKNTLISRYQCLSAGELIGEEQIEEILKTEGASIKNIKAKLKEHFEQNIIPKMDKSKEDYSKNMLKYYEEKQYFEAVLKELGAEMPESAQIDELLKSPIWTKEEFTKKAKELESTQANLVKFNPIITKYDLGKVVTVNPELDLDVKFVSDFDVEEEKEETETKLDQSKKEEVKEETEEKEEVKKTKEEKGKEIEEKSKELTEEKKEEVKETTGETVKIIKDSKESTEKTHGKPVPPPRPPREGQKIVAEETKVVENFAHEEKIEPKAEIKAETNQFEEPEFVLTREDRPHLDVETFIYKGGDFSKVNDDKYFKEAPLSVEKRKKGFTPKDAYIIDRVIGSGKYNPDDTKYPMEERYKNLLSLLDSLSPNAKKYASWASESGKSLMAFAMDQAFDNAQKAEFLAKFGNVFLRSKAKDDIAFGINELFILDYPQMIFAKNNEGKSAVLSEEFLEREKNLGRETKNDFVTKSFDKLNKQFAKEATKEERENPETTKEEREKPEETKEYENLAYFATTMPEDILKDKELLEKLIKVAKNANRTIGQDGRLAYVAKDKDALYAFAQGLSENPNFSSLDPSILKTLATTNNFVGQIKGFENTGMTKGGDDGDGQSL